MAAPETPITRLEKYWAAILDKIQGGGSAPVLETLTVSENGTYTPDPGVDGFDKVDAQVAPPDPEWRRFFATGTLDAPYTYEDWITINARASELYIKMDMDATAIGAGTAGALAYASASVSTYGETHFSACMIPSMDISSVFAAEIVIAHSGVDESIRLNSALMMQQGAIVDLSQYASLMPTITTFVYRVRPSN